MSDKDQAARAEILARLAASREELSACSILRNRAVDGGAMPGQPSSGAFPRSRTMQMLMSGRGLGTLGAAAAGLLLARPAWHCAYCACCRRMPSPACWWRARSPRCVRNNKPKRTNRPPRASAQGDHSVVIAAVIDQMDFTGRDRQVLTIE